MREKKKKKSTLDTRGCCAEWEQTWCGLGVLRVGESPSGLLTALDTPPSCHVHFVRGPFVHFILSSQDYVIQMMKPLYSLFLPFLLTWSFSVLAGSCFCLCTMAVSHPLLLCMAFTGVTGKCAVRARPLVPPAPFWEQTQDCGALLGLIPDPQPTHTCPVSCQSPVALRFRHCANNPTLIRCLVSRDKMLLCWALCHHRFFWSCCAAVPENKTTGTSGWRVYRRAFQPPASPLKPHQRYRKLSLDQTELWAQCLCGSRLLFLGKSQLESARARPQPESQLDAAWPLLLSAHWVLRPTPAKQTAKCWRNPAEHSITATSWVLCMGIQTGSICMGPSQLPGLFQGPQIGRWRLKAAPIRVKWCYPSCVDKKLSSKKLCRWLEVCQERKSKL